MKTPGQIAYESSLEENPKYPDGSPRKTWEQLPIWAKKSWEKLPLA